MISTTKFLTIGVVCLVAFVMLSSGELVSSSNRGKSRARRARFDWQIPEPTQHPTTTSTTRATTTTAEPIVVEKINVTSMLIRDGTIQINADDVMHKVEAEGIGDVGLILWGAPSKKTSKSQTTPTHAPSTTMVSTASNIAKIMELVPSADEDMIRVVKLAEDEHYGKGWAKPKYISMVLAKMNSTEYKADEATTTDKNSANQTSEKGTQKPDSTTRTTETSHESMTIKSVLSEKLVKAVSTDAPNESTTPIIMGEHMEYSISMTM